MVYFDTNMALRTWLVRLRDVLVDLSANRAFRSLVFVAIIVLVPMAILQASPTYAQTPGTAGAMGGGSTSPFIEQVASIIMTLMLEVMKLLIDLILWMVSALISIAKYNDFVNSPPVVIGWVLVRDVVNMFFIVVLLLVAFSTIIGYKDFHYKAVLPKLLLMAVLINFSRTLVGVLIDFSQVITLTFVNGFQAAAGGNFIQAFQLTKIATLSQRDPNLNGAMGLIGAGLLGIFVLIIASTTLLIMMLFFVARVVVLWMLLIFSPIAFFALALPGSMSKALGPFTGDWWSKLSTVLTGGPIVAFCLWLSLAVVQSRPEYFGSEMYKPSSSSANETARVGITEVGDPGSLFTLMISIVMMLKGVEMAVTSSAGLSKSVGDLAGKIKSVGGPVGIGKKALGVAARASGRATVATAGFVDRRMGISQGVSAKMMKIADNRANAGGFINRQLATVAGSVGAAGARVGASRRAEYKKTIEEKTRGLTGETKAQMLNAIRAGEGGIFGNKDLGKTAEAERLTVVTSAGVRKGQQRKREEELKNGGMDEKSAKDKATEESKIAYANNLRTIQSAAKAKGDFEKSDEIDALYAKDPSLLVDLNKRPDEDEAMMQDRNKNMMQEFIKKQMNDPDKFFQNLQTSALGNSYVAAALMEKGSDGMAIHNVDKFLYDRNGKPNGNRVKELEKGLGQSLSVRDEKKEMNFSTMTSNLQPAIQQNLSQAFTNAGIDQSKQEVIARSMGRQIDARAANAMSEEAKHLGGSNVNAVSAVNLIQEGIPANVVFNVQTDGAYGQNEYKAAHAEMLDDGFEYLSKPEMFDDAHKAERLQALNSVTQGMNTSLLENTESAVAGTVVGALDKHFDTLMKHVQHGGMAGSQVAELGKVMSRLKEIQSQNAEKMASGQKLNKTEQNIDEIVSKKFAEHADILRTIARTEEPKNRKSGKAEKKGKGSSGTGSST